MRILVFDSGLGGLTVHRHIRLALPEADYVYLADDAVFPYGALGEEELVARVLDVLLPVVAREAPEVVVIACNTASTLVLPPLRERLRIPVVGTVPAIKPAAVQSRSRMISVLATPGTVKRDYTRALIDEFAADCEVALRGAPRLAELAEAALHGRPVSDAAIAGELSGVFVEKEGRRTDTVVLACTHYPLLLDRLEALAPWPVTWIDPAPAIARRVVDLVGRPSGHGKAAAGRALFTSGRAPEPALAAALAEVGLVSVR